MKRKITGIVYLLIFVCNLLLLTACSIPGVKPRPKTYDFPCIEQEIVNVKLMYNEERRNGSHQGTDQSKMRVLKELSSEEIEAFMTELYALETRRVGTPPPWGYGAYFAVVTYANGDAEIYSALNIEYIPAGSEMTGYSDYCFSDERAVQSLIKKYLAE